MNISEIRSIIKEIVDESWLSDRLPSTNFSFQMGDREKTTQSYWIKPDGTEFRTTFRGHSEKASQILKAYPDKEKEMIKKDPQVILWEMGWISLQITVPDAKAIVKHYVIIPISPAQISTLRNIATRFNDDQTHVKKIDIIYDTTNDRDIILESMFPKEFDRHKPGSCLSAAAHATYYFLTKDITNFKIIEGFVSLSSDQKSEEWAPHTWIQFDNGKIFDPTKKQWKHHGFDPDRSKYEKISRTFTPQQYLKLCNIQGDLPDSIKLEESVSLDERLTFADLYDDTDDERIAKSELPGMRVRPLQVTTNNDRDLWRFDYSYISSERSEYQQYGGKIGHKGHIYFFKEDIDPNDNLEDLECMVDCDCRDFKYRWAYALAQDDASIVGNKSLNKSTGAPPVKTNPLGHQQLCKHLSALRKYVVTNIEKAMAKTPYRKRPMNIFESMDQLANKGKFVTGYYDKRGK